MMSARMDSELVSFIATAERGDTRAAEALLATLYSELERVKSGLAGKGGSSGAVPVTSLLHEA
jgi:hypothetical protein